MEPNYTKLGQGPARLADAEQLDKDQKGYTHPNLHRRIIEPGEVTPPEFQNNYKLGVYGLNSYRTAETLYHDEESVDTEIP